MELNGSAVTEKSHAIVAKISDEMTLPASAGTFDEFRTKPTPAPQQQLGSDRVIHRCCVAACCDKQVLQFGYVSMFSVAFPAGGLAALATNIIELKLDAYKFVFATRRPPYEGADGIGAWAPVLRTYSWIALVINVLVVAYATNSVRDYIVIPQYATLSTCETTTDDSLISTEARFFGQQTSWKSSCAENYRNCFVDIGAVSWLPASTYLDPNEHRTRPYTEEGLCNPGSSLYHEAHCSMCRHRTAETYLGLTWFVLIMEHLLILLKIGVLVMVPDKPAWVRKNEARSHQEKERIAIQVEKDPLRAKTGDPRDQTSTVSRPCTETLARDVRCAWSLGLHAGRWVLCPGVLQWPYGMRRVAASFRRRDLACGGVATEFLTCVVCFFVRHSQEPDMSCAVLWRRLR
eukprot:7377051-Prymnesium_polylepis.1